MKIDLEELGTVEKLDFIQLDSHLLVSEVQSILNKHPLCPKTFQLSLVHAKGIEGEARYYCGLGSLWNKEKTGYCTDPTLFSCFNRDLEGGEIHRAYQALKKICPLELGRVRIMAREPGGATSMHVDDASRFHIPIVSNESCFFDFRDQGLFKMPEIGQLYFFDAEEYHCAANNGESLRVHIIFDTIPPDYEDYLEE